jgi:hypothetical protein
MTFDGVFAGIADDGAVMVAARFGGKSSGTVTVAVEEWVWGDAPPVIFPRLNR